jgi:hypothetical protein
MEQMTRANRLDPVMRHIWTGIESSNASSMILVLRGGFHDTATRGPFYGMREIALRGDVKVLDAITLDSKATPTAAEAGLLQPRPGYAVKGAAEPGDELLTTYSNADVLRRERERLAAAGQDEAVRKLAADKAIADAQREAFALTGSDRPADKPGQDSLFEPASGYPGSLDRPMSRGDALDAADARVSEADANAEKGILAAVNCDIVEGGK